MTKRNLVWLASYPKSGNTWVRIFLANYLFAKTAPVPINQIHRIGMGDAVTRTYRLVAKGPFDPADAQKSVALRGKVLRGIAANGADINLVKTHNAKTRAFGVELIPPALTRSAVYIIRNPLDMILSYARHYGLDVATSARNIGRADNTVAGSEDAVAQFLGNWSTHVKSWTRTRDFPVLTLRYEDMLADPSAAFAALVRHIGLDLDPEKLERAVRFSSFEEAKAQEQREPFVERSRNSESFFHSGTAGHWKDSLPAAAVERITQDHKAVMTEFAYL